MKRPLTVDELDRLAEVFSGWLAVELDTNPAVDSVEGNLGERWWYVRLLGEAKDVVAVKFDLAQRTLSYESYVMPYPEENHAELFEMILKLNSRLYGAAFSIGAESGIYLKGQIAAEAIDDPGEMDRVMGSLYTGVEDNFGRLIRLGFASRF